MREAPKKELRNTSNGDSDIHSPRGLGGLHGVLGAIIPSSLGVRDQASLPRPPKVGREIPGMWIKVLGSRSESSG